jgi:NCAIR mutase (PurE)-related protein
MLKLAERNDRVLATRATPEQYAATGAMFANWTSTARTPPELHYNQAARCIWVDREPERARHQGVVLVAAGTSDLPVLEEAAITLDLMGHEAHQIFDIGVAGIHRIVPHIQRLQEAAVVVVFAGMEGALASVVAGLTDAPVIAVPTSVGYGASFHGLAALLAMLNSCASGVAVVNIDNGYGAACMAAQINQRIQNARRESYVESGS